MDIKQFQSELGYKLSYQLVYPSEGNLDYIIYIHGYFSNMFGTKAEYLLNLAQNIGCGFLRFNLAGHGENPSKDFLNCDFKEWYINTKEILALLPKDAKLHVVGSSMGGWLGLLLMLDNQFVKTFTGLAPAVDFTNQIIPNTFPAEMITELNSKGITYLYTNDISMPFTKNFFDSTKDFLIANRLFQIIKPIRIIQGVKDESVPYSEVISVFEKISSADCDLLLIKNADHRLSDDATLKKIGQIIKNLIIQS